MRCKRNVSKTDKKGRDYVGCCANKARHFYRVTYGTKLQWATHHSNEDTFGFCDRCNEGMSHPSSWTQGWAKLGAVYHLKGSVVSLTVSTEDNAASDKQEAFREGLKLKLKNAMRLKRTQKVTETEWQEIFQEALHEHVIESVMGS